MNLHLLRFGAFAMIAITAAPLAALDSKPGNLSITHPWTRQTAPGQVNGGGFMTIANSGKQPDRLLSASSPVAGKVEVHTMSMESGVMRMRPVNGGLAIPAHGKLELKPGSYHIMLIGLKKRLELGKRVPLTLRFERAGAITLQLKVESVSYGTEARDDRP